jgi:hypothetical protein
MTTFSDGVFQYGGMPVGVGSFAAQKVFYNVAGRQNKGRAWFVDTSYGGNGNGRSPATAFSTMARAFASIASGDVIYVIGKVVEQLVTPVQIFDVTVVGCGNRPRHADATPAGGNWAASQWAPPASGGVAAQATVRVLQQGWRFMNLLFTAVDANAACIEIVRNAGAGDAERDASHASILGCRFAGAGIGIRGGVAGVFTEIPFNVEVGWCQFDGMTTAMAGTIECNQWFIHDNVFGTNTNQIIMAARNFIIKDNVIGAFTAAANSGGIDLRGGAGANQVVWNSLSGTYSAAGGYQEAQSTDTWNGNAGSAGITAGVP